MKRLFGLGMALCLAVTTTGCCRFASHVENEFGDFVDYVNLREPDLTHLYHPGLDPLRIGKPDWCCYEFNRKLCPCACGPEPVYLPAYPPPPVVLEGEVGPPPGETVPGPEAVPGLEAMPEPETAPEGMPAPPPAEEPVPPDADS